MQVFEPNDICPGCYSKVTTHKCPKCKATRSINAASGREIWMRNGVVVKGGVFHNSRVASFEMKKRLRADPKRMAAYEGTLEPSRVAAGTVKAGEGSSVAPTESTSEDKLAEWKAEGSPQKKVSRKKKSEK